MIEDASKWLLRHRKAKAFLNRGTWLLQVRNQLFCKVLFPNFLLLNTIKNQEPIQGIDIQIFEAKIIIQLTMVFSLLIKWAFC